MTENMELNTYLERLDIARGQITYASKDILNVLDHAEEALGAGDEEALDNAITDLNWAISSLVQHGLAAQGILLQARAQQ